MIFICPAAALALIALFVFVPKRELRTEIEIGASASAVWEVLRDFPAYPGWNPFITHIEGTLRPGERLKVRLSSHGGAARTFHPVLLSVDPGLLIRWRGRLALPRLFDGEHYFALVPSGEGTRFVHGESFSGVLLWLVGTDRFEADFRSMNEALKQRVNATIIPPSSPMLP
ncbi:MAG: SRPBCC domain-containing protein [Parvibaculaceae bacterium]|nr:SRPBCC domain-containing protein [Parvibaculaceae bacterium]